MIHGADTLIFGIVLGGLAFHITYKTYQDVKNWQDKDRIQMAVLLAGIFFADFGLYKLFQKYFPAIVGFSYFLGSLGLFLATVIVFTMIFAVTNE